MAVINRLVLCGGMGLAYTGGGPMLKPRSGSGGSPSRTDIIDFTLLLPFMSVPVATGRTAIKPTVSGSVVEASSDSKFRLFNCGRRQNQRTSPGIAPSGIERQLRD